MTTPNDSKPKHGEPGHERHVTACAGCAREAFGIPSTGPRDPEWQARVVANAILNAFPAQCDVADCSREAFPDTGKCYKHSKERP